MEGILMAKKDEIARQSGIKNDKAASPAGLDQQEAPKDEHGPGRQSPDPHGGNQGRHGSGEGLTGMQPGAGHPRGR